MGKYDARIAELEAKYGIPTGLYHKVVHLGERSGETAVSPKGAIGLAQLRPGTARDMGVRNIWDPDENLEGGAKYLRLGYDQNGDWKLAVAGYNAGHNAVKKAGGIPNFRETQDYVGRVYGMAVAPNAAQPGGGVPPPPAPPTVVDQAEATAMEAAQRGIKHSEDASKEAEARIDQNYGRIREIAGELESRGELPLPPTLQGVKMPPNPDDHIKDPTRVMGQFLPMMAVLGSLATRNGATTALKAAAAAMNAQKKQDRESLQFANDEWKANMETVLQNNKLETDRYLAVLQNREMGLKEKQAELSTLAAMDNNAQLKAMISNGQLGEVYKFLQMRDMAAYRLAQVYDMAERRRLEGERLKLDTQRAADLDAYRTRQNELREASGSKETLGQYIARLREEKRTGQTRTGTPWGVNDDEALQAAEANWSRMNFGAVVTGAGGGGGGAPAGQPIPMPASKDQLVVGQLYATPRGNGVWDGQKFNAQ